MTPRERFMAVLAGESNEIIPWTMGFFDEKLAAELLGEECVPSDIIPREDFSYGASPREDWEVKALYAERADIPAVPVGWGHSIAFGHGGPGEFAEKTISRTENRRVTMYETGVYKEVRYNPHFYHHYNYPLESLEDLDVYLPDPNDPKRYEGLAEEIAYHKDKGRLTYGSLNGFFSGVHYFFYPYDKFLMDLLLQPRAAKELIERLGTYNLQVAEHLLKAGLDILCFCDDLGSDTSLIISPELYRQYFRPWHGELADLCRSYNAILHLHSHGNINPLMEDLYDIGINLLNPLDPSEGMDIAELAERYGDRITFVGGINKHFFNWDENRQWEYLDHLFSTVKPGFFLMDSGGIPEHVTKDAWDRFTDMRRRLKEKYRR